MAALLEKLSSMLMLLAMSRSLDGTLVRVELKAPANLTVHAENQFQTLTLADGVSLERECRVAGEPTRTVRIPLSDLTPGEYLKLEIDSQGRVAQVRAVVDVERQKVRSASGEKVILENGTTLTIGSVLRFIDETGKPSSTATLKPGQTVLLYRHPDTHNIYRFSAEPREPRRTETKAKSH